MTHFFRQYLLWLWPSSKRVPPSPLLHPQLMTHFFRQYLLYVTFEVLEPLWRAVQARVQAAESLDEVRGRILH